MLWRKTEKEMHHSGEVTFEKNSEGVNCEDMQEKAL